LIQSNLGIESLADASRERERERGGRGGRERESDERHRGEVRRRRGGAEWNARMERDV
jgi:hypothetical protein